MERINLLDKFERFDAYWQPKIVAELNGQYVKLAKLQGEFVWHQHAEEDELFLVIEGKLRMQFRDRDVMLESGDMVVVPAGVEHRPVAERETWVVLLEPKGTSNTGNVRNERTVDEPEWI